MNNNLIYLDNAATTPIDLEVCEVMQDALMNCFGNPSSIHQVGRKAKGKIETVRKDIAKILNASPSEIVFTSGGTEANNMAINCSVKDLNVRHIITSKIEHHAVENPILNLEKSSNISVSYVALDSLGNVDLESLENLLKSDLKTMVCLMHGNNELGNLLDLKKVSDLCLQYNAIFQTDTVQTIGHLNLDLKAISIDFLSFSAHKIHGPKGVGFIYINKKNKIQAIQFGGSQERNLRAGTENVPSIIGMGKALEIAYLNLDANELYIKSLKLYFKEQLLKSIPGVLFNGDVSNNSLSTILNVQFPYEKSTDMVLFSLDMEGISVSGGSACSSGSNKGSHVLQNIDSDLQKSNLRFSFSRNNTLLEIDSVISILKKY